MDFFDFLSFANIIFALNIVQLDICIELPQATKIVISLNRNSYSRSDSNRLFRIEYSRVRPKKLPDFAWYSF